MAVAWPVGAGTVVSGLVERSLDVALAQWLHRRNLVGHAP
jgi:hypothetical protein